jgi:hypothetical protein
MTGSSMTYVCQYGLLLGAMISLVIPTQGFAADVRKKDASGFSEIEVPQVKQAIPFGRIPTDAKTPPTVKSSPAAPNQPIQCGPDNAQSEACKAK